jgi:hypothetical protein
METPLAERYGAAASSKSRTGCLIKSTRLTPHLARTAANYSSFIALPIIRTFADQAGIAIENVRYASGSSHGFRFALADRR